MISPDSLSENKVFNDGKMAYKQDVKYEPGAFDRFMEWLAEKVFGNNNYDSIDSARELIIWIIVIISVVVVIWLLWRSDFSRLIRPQSKMTTFNFNEITEDLSAINFDKTIEEAVKSSDYRVAIRWHYLKCLYLLEKGGHLVFQPSKTNIEYQSDLKKSGFLREFIDISRIYDYVWYGKFTVDQNKYTDIKNEFVTFESRVNVQRQ